MTAQLTRFAAVDAGVVAPEVRVSSTIFLGLEGQDRDGRLFAVAVGQAQIFHS